MDDSKMEQKLDQIAEDIGEVKTHLAVYNSQLKIHIRRSEMLEKRIIPLETLRQRIIGATKLIGLAAALTALIEFSMHFLR